MKVSAVSFTFANNSRVNFKLAGPDAPLCDSEHQQQFHNKPYKWEVQVFYNGKATGFYTFASPTSATARRMVQNLKNS